MMFVVMIDEQHHLEPPANGPGAVTYELDLESGELKWSSTLSTVFGYGMFEPVHTLEWWTDHIHPEDAMAVNEAMDMLMYPWVREWTVDYRFEKADKTYVPVHDRATVERDQAGKAVRLVGTIWQSGPTGSEVNQ